jgi:hypothetical protein
VLLISSFTAAVLLIAYALYVAVSLRADDFAQLSAEAAAEGAAERQLAERRIRHLERLEAYERRTRALMLDQDGLDSPRSSKGHGEDGGELWTNGP